MIKQSARSLASNARVLRLPQVGAFAFAAAIVFLIGPALREASAQSSFDDDFDSTT